MGVALTGLTTHDSRPDKTHNTRVTSWQDSQNTDDVSTGSQNMSTHNIKEWMLTSTYQAIFAAIHRECIGGGVGVWKTVLTRFITLNSN